VGDPITTEFDAGPNIAINPDCAGLFLLLLMSFIF
jgi:hypothetical protein